MEEGVCTFHKRTVHLLPAAVGACLINRALFLLTKGTLDKSPNIGKLDRHDNTSAVSLCSLHSAVLWINTGIIFFGFPFHAF